MLSKLTVITALLVSSVFAAPGLPNLDKLRRSTTGKVIPNSYIVVLKDGASRKASLQGLGELVVGLTDIKEVTHADWTVLNGYGATLTGAALQFVLNDPAVEYVEENGIVSVNWKQGDSASPPSPSVSYLEDAPELGKRQAGNGVDIYSVDTGVRITHRAFGGRASWGANFIGGKNEDGNGHGTHTAATAAGINFGPATSARVIAVKVLGDNGKGTFASIISGVNYATVTAQLSRRPSVVNMSLGGGAFAALDTAVQASIAVGLHYLIAAGNDNIDAKGVSPARVRNAITVGAIDSAKQKASFSNHGSVLDLWYLGVNVRSAWYTSDTAENTISGTSMATPGVAGIAADIISRTGNTTPRKLQEDLVNRAIQDVVGAPVGTTNRRAVSA